MYVKAAPDLRRRCFVENGNNMIGIISSCSLAQLHVHCPVRRKESGTASISLKELRVKKCKGASAKLH
jgi:hypothetical protein